MTLETRASRAVRAIQDSVAGVAPTPVRMVARRHRLSLVGGGVWVAALVLAGVFVANSLTGQLVVDDMASVTIPDGSADPVTTVPKGDDEPSMPVAIIDPRAYPDHGAEGVFQYNGTWADPNPFTKFFGAGPPGTVVEATSAFGSASTVVGLTGEFVLKVAFEDPPPGVEFPVTITMGGETFTFGFTWTWDPADQAVTAHQTFGSSSSSTPYEIFYGTAPPGTLVTASSPYGSGKTTVGSKGEWALKVFFSGAPSGKVFTVQVDVGGHGFSFPFTWTQAPAPTSFSVLEVHKDEGQGQWMKVYVSGAKGTEVRLTSPYGSSDLVTLDGSGEAWVKVFFSGAPKGETFSVALLVNGATHSSHSFTSQWDPADTPITIDVWTEWKTDSAKVKAYGTAPPGTSVSVETNGYGSAVGSAGDNGKYTVLLQLSPLPEHGATIEVTVTVGSEVKTFVFTYEP